MTHALFGDRFLGARQPAWHKLGYVAPEGEKWTAEAAFNRAPFITDLMPLFGHMQNPLTGAMQVLQIQEQAIRRWPTPDDPEVRVFGVVGPEYHLITPERVTQIWDKAVGKEVETFGALNLGREVFISVRLPGFKVGKDDHDNYLILWAPWDGLHAYRVFTAPVRVVCQNTLMMALELAGECFKVTHGKNSEHQLIKWMSGIYERALARNGEIVQTLDLLESVPVNDREFETLLHRALPLPTPPRIVPDRATMDKRDAAWEIQKKAVERKRSQVTLLWQGMGTEIHPTANGFWQATLEAIQRAPIKKEEVAVYDMMFGNRAAMQVDAFNVAYDFAQRKVG